MSRRRSSSRCWIRLMPGSSARSLTAERARSTRSAMVDGRVFRKVARHGVLKVQVFGGAGGLLHFLLHLLDAHVAGVRAAMRCNLAEFEMGFAAGFGTGFVCGLRGGTLTLLD